MTKSYYPAILVTEINFLLTSQRFIKVCIIFNRVATLLVPPIIAYYRTIFVLASCPVFSGVAVPASPLPPELQCTATCHHCHVVS